MNTQDIHQEDLEVETEAVEAVETTDPTLHIQTGVQAGLQIYTPIHAAVDGATKLYDVVSSWW